MLRRRCASPSGSRLSSCSCNLQDSQLVVDSNLQFVKARIEDLRRQVTESESTIRSRGQKGGRRQWTLLEDWIGA